MMIRKTDGTHVQGIPALEWSVTVPEGRTNVELIGVYSTDGRTSIPYDNVEFVAGVLTIFFGIDAVAGVARYEYDAQGEVSTVTGNGGVINVHQYNYPKA